MRLELLLTAALTAAACNDATMKGQSAQVAAPEKITTACDAQGEYADEELVLDVRREKATQLFVEGEFCPLAPAQLRLVFVVDFSLSMYNAQHSRGNDQVIDGTCGRLEAARAIVARQRKAVAGQKAIVEVGTVPFGSKLVDGVPLTAIERFEEHLTVENFCRGIDGTNYKAAFEGAQAMLADEPGTKHLYFISDGLPTEGGDAPRKIAAEHRDAALAAARALKTKVKGLVFNTVYLGNFFELEDQVYDPEAFLEELTGDKSRVKIVAKAEDLAREIVTLENPPVRLAVDTAKAVVSAAGARAFEVPFRRFEADEEKEQTWRFVTETFTAFPGTDMASELTVSAEDEDGQEFSVTFRIKPRDRD